jgi:hypothetical protein
MPGTLAGPFVQAGCGTFGLFTLDAAGAVTAYGRTFSSAVGPVDAGTNVADLPAGLVASGLAMACGFAHCCVISSSGLPECWGGDYAGQVSNAPRTVAASAYVPAKLGSGSTPTIAPSGPQTITGHIFCDNQFEFYFNGQLIATDPMAFTPHQVRTARPPPTLSSLGKHRLKALHGGDCDGLSCTSLALLESGIVSGCPDDHTSVSSVVPSIQRRRGSCQSERCRRRMTDRHMDRCRGHAGGRGVVPVGRRKRQDVRHHVRGLRLGLRVRVH